MVPNVPAAWVRNTGPEGPWRINREKMAICAEMRGSEAAITHPNTGPMVWPGPDEDTECALVAHNLAMFIMMDGREDKFDVAFQGVTRLLCDYVPSKIR